MEMVQILQSLERDGEIKITGLPYKAGQTVRVIMYPQPSSGKRSRLTVGQLRRSGLIGLWQDRDDINDSSAYARHLREQAQRREDVVP